MKQAQFEIMGLAIAVVIISVGVLFLVTLSLSSSSGQDVTSVFQQDQFTKNTLDAYLKASHPACPQRSTQRYFLWSVTGGGASECRDETTWSEPGGLNDTLHRAITTYIGREYYFVVREDICEDPYGSGCEAVFESGTCDPTRDSTGGAGRQTIGKYPADGSVEIILWICNPQ